MAESSGSMMGFASVKTLDLERLAKCRKMAVFNNLPRQTLRT